MGPELDIPSGYRHEEFPIRLVIGGFRVTHAQLEEIGRQVLPEKMLALHGKQTRGAPNLFYNAILILDNHFFNRHKYLSNYISTAVDRYNLVHDYIFIHSFGIAFTEEQVRERKRSFRIKSERKRAVFFSWLPVHVLEANPSLLEGVAWEVSCWDHLWYNSELPQKYEDLVDHWCQKRWARLCLKGEQDKPRDAPPHFQCYHAVFPDVPPETIISPEEALQAPDFDIESAVGVGGVIHPEVDESEDEDWEDDESEDEEPENDKSEDKRSEDNESEDHQSEDHQSEDHQSKNDA
ncbi:hypothetical protein C2E23DRAFT_881205 [Lenzites betulinus]|nr:hypothetical protein C2E23DRAFT_881205 [Lenzites betulinus]